MVSSVNSRERSPSPAADSSNGTKRPRDPSSPPEADAPAAQRPRLSSQAASAQDDVQAQWVAECGRFAASLQTYADRLSATPQAQANLRRIFLDQVMRPVQRLGLLRSIPSTALTAPTPPAPSSVALVSPGARSATAATLQGQIPSIATPQALQSAAQRSAYLLALQQLAPSPDSRQPQAGSPAVPPQQQGTTAQRQSLAPVYELGSGLVAAGDWAAFKDGLDTLVNEGAGEFITSELVQALAKLPVRGWTPLAANIARSVQKWPRNMPCHLLFSIGVDAPHLLSALSDVRAVSVLAALAPDARSTRLETLRTLADAGISLRKHVTLHVLRAAPDNLEDDLAHIFSAIFEGQSTAPHDVLVDCLLFAPWAYERLSSPPDTLTDLCFGYENALSDHSVYRTVSDQAKVAALPLWPWQRLGLCLLEPEARQHAMDAAKAHQQRTGAKPLHDLQPSHWDCFLYAPRTTVDLDLETLVALAKMDAHARVVLLQNIAAHFPVYAQRGHQLKALAALSNENQTVFFDLQAVLSEVAQGDGAIGQASYWLQRHSWLITKILEMPQSRRKANIVLAIAPLVNLVNANSTYLAAAGAISRDHFDRLVPETLESLATLSDASLDQLAVEVRPLLQCLMQSDRPGDAVVQIAKLAQEDRCRRIRFVLDAYEALSLATGPLTDSAALLDVCLSRPVDQSRVWLHAARSLGKTLAHGTDLEDLLVILRDHPTDDVKALCDDTLIALHGHMRGKTRSKVIKAFAQIREGRAEAARILRTIANTPKFRPAYAQLLLVLSPEGRRKLSEIGPELAGRLALTQVEQLTNLLNGVDLNDRPVFLERLKRLRRWRSEASAVMQFIEKLRAQDRLPIVEIISPLLDGAHRTDRVLAFTTHLHWLPTGERQAFIDLCMPLLDGDYDVDSLSEKTYQVVRASMVERPRTLAQQLNRPALVNVHGGGQDGRAQASLVQLRAQIQGPMLTKDDAIDLATTLCEGGGDFGRNDDRIAFGAQRRGGKSELENALRTLRGEYIDGVDQSVALANNQALALGEFGTLGMGDILALVMRAIETYVSPDGSEATQAARTDMWFHLARELAYCSDEGDPERDVPAHRVCQRGVLRHLMCVPQGYYGNVHVDDTATPQEFLSAQSRMFFLENERFPSGGRVGENDPTPADLENFYRNTLALGLDALGRQNTVDQEVLGEHLRAYLLDTYEWSPSQPS